MFDHVQGASPALIRTFTPPVPVWVDMAEVFRSGVSRPGDRSTLLVRAQGLPLLQKAPGVLYAWVRETSGAWLGYVAYPLNGGPTLGEIRSSHLVPANAVRRRQPKQSP